MIGQMLIPLAEARANFQPATACVVYLKLRAHGLSPPMTHTSLHCRLLLSLERQLPDQLPPKGEDCQTSQGLSSPSNFSSEIESFPQQLYHNPCCANTLLPQPPQHRAAHSRFYPAAARDQADKMAPEPTPDRPEHKKKVNLTYVACNLRLLKLKIVG